MKKFLRIIDLISFKVIPIFLIVVSILYFFYPEYVYSDYVRYGDWDYHFPIYIWFRGDAFYLFITELMVNNILIVFAVILIGIGKGIHSIELIKKFIYFWPLYFLISVGVLSDFAGGIYNQNSLLFYVSFTLSQLMYLLIYKIFKSEKNYFNFYIKKIFQPIFEINEGIFRLLIVIFSMFSLILANSFIGGMFYGFEHFIFGILIAILFFFLLWFFVWLLLVLNVIDWVMKGFNEK